MYTSNFAYAFLHATTVLQSVNEPAEDVWSIILDFGIKANLPRQLSNDDGKPARPAG